ncbi:MAG: di-trans,poly-cis-decaprenylcistransferase [Gammaproteobacteria bacterium]|nr:di-trans,poly-cis-decaprenylcistransferase [Gammaproteobacteria bacterium]
MTSTPPPTPPEAVPAHVAIVMDGNGRWAKKRGQPRAFGHRAGVKSVRRIVGECRKRGVRALTLFAFSQENWQRPALEVTLLMQLFLQTLAREIESLHKNDIRLRFIGEHQDFPADLRTLMRKAEKQTAKNKSLVLAIAVGYGGQWDIAQAAQALCREGQAITPEALESRLVTAGLPAPDLMIRTGGEQRISNFLLWQLAYTELYFCDTLWPDFGEAEFDRALQWYAGRERRFGRVPEGA